MFINNWNNSNYIPFNQKTGNEYRQFLQQRITNQQTRLTVTKNKLAKCHSNDKNNMQSLKAKIEKLEYNLECDELALANLEWDIAEDAKLDADGLFGKSVLGRSISAVAQAIVFPAVAALHFAEKHPIMVGSMLLALQTYQAVAAPVIQAVTNANLNDTGTNDYTPTESSSSENTIPAPTSNYHAEACLRFSHTKDANNTINHRVYYQVVNHCNTSQPVHVVRECHSDGLYSTGPFLFSVPPHGKINITAHEKAYLDDVDEDNRPERVYFDEYDCTVPVKAGHPLVIKKGCLRGYHLDGGQRKSAVTYKMINVCDKQVFGFVESKCQNGTREFELSKFGDEKIITTKYFENCASYVQEGRILKRYEERFCKTGMPKMEKIIGGRKIDSTSRSHLAYVVLPSSVCTGTFITKNHLLTAAHCVVDEPINVLAADDVTVRVGFSKGPAYKVTDGYLMSGYLDSTLSFDIKRNYDLAVLELAEAPKEATKVTLATDEHFCQFAKELDKILATNMGYPDRMTSGWNKNAAAWRNNNTAAQGFGYQLNADGGHVRSTEPRETGLLVTNMLHGNRILYAQSPIGANLLSSSPGDSGGPLLFKTEAEPLVQIGVLVAGDNEKYSFSWATNIHYPEAREWITSIIDGKPDLSKSTRLKLSCAKASITYDGFFGLLTGTKKAKLTNNCPFPVQVSFEDKKTKDMEGDVIPDLVIPKGETRMLYGKGSIKPVFTEKF